MADATPPTADAAAASVATAAEPAAPAAAVPLSDEEQREAERQARLARKRDNDRIYRQKKNEEKAKAAARKQTAGGAAAAAKPKHTAHAAAAHSAAASADKPLTAESSSPKRLKRAHPATSGAADDDDEGTVAGSSHPSPAVWSILADLVFLPRFLSLVHTQLATTRTANINFHMLASAFRQKLVEGGWQRDQHYTLHGPTEALINESKEESAAASAAAASSAPPAGVYLLKSKRAVSDFTPSVCQRLWSLVAYQRDSSPQAAVELLHAGTRHRRLEERCRELRIPIMTGGKIAPPPQGATIKIERMFGLPKGADIGIKGAAAPASTAADAASGAPGAAAAPPAAAAPAPADDDDSDVEDTFEFWPGMFGESLHGPQYRLDGATVQRWARGQHVHVPPIAQDPTAKCNTHGLPLVSPAAALGITEPAQVALINQLSSRASLVSQVNQLRGTFRSAVNRGVVHLDWSSGDWNADVPTSREIVHKAVSSMVPTSMLAKAETTVAQWISPSDDRNLLDGVCDWIQRQPLPTRESFGGGTPTITVLLPRTVSAWLEIRHAIAATQFPVGFLRRRWWLLCGESSRFEQEQRAAATEAATSGRPMPPVRNPALAALSEQITNITNLLSQRIGQFMQEHDSSSAPAANAQQKPTENQAAAAAATQPAEPAAPATDAATLATAPAAALSVAAAAALASSDAPQAMELDAPPALS